MIIIKKRGVTLVGLGIVLVVMIVLGTVITVSAVDSINNAKKLAFALEISSIQELLTGYYNESNNEEYPEINEITIDTTNLGSNLEEQFVSETVTSNKILLFEVDLSRIGIEDTEYGNNTNSLDKYVFSKETGRVYYLQGLKVGNKKYYTLTEDLIKIINDAQTEEEQTSVIADANTPTITTGGFRVNSKTDNTGKDIYLINIDVTDSGNDIKTIKYETEIIAFDNAKEYFSSYGKELKGNSIKVNESTNITIYAEDKSGNYSIKQEGVPFIPLGFYYVGGSIPTGVVISDNVADANKGTASNGDVTSNSLLGNQFVWVPVNDIRQFVRRAGYSSGSLQSFNTTSYTEPFSQTYTGVTPNVTLSLENDLTGEYAEYNAMVDSVERYGGFYIGRYEAGTTTARSSSTTITTDVLVQKGKPVYNYVGWGPSMISATGDVTDTSSKSRGKGAVEISRSMYPNDENNTTGAISTLCYGVQWDATIKWMEDVQNTNITPNKQYIKDSTGMGWYKTSLHNTGVDMTNSVNKVNNIYDMAGNIWERTMEAYSTYHRVVRGGNYINGGAVTPASRRDGTSSNYAGVDYGFRPSLYIK